MKKGKNILVIDDNYLELKKLLEILSNVGYKVKTALGGQSGIEALNSFRPDLILISSDMKNFDGFETCVKIKKFKKAEDIPVIMLLSENHADLISKCYKSGCVDFVKKTFENDELLYKIIVNVQQYKQKRRLLKKNRYLEEKVRLLRNEIDKLKNNGSKLV